MSEAANPEEIPGQEPAPQRSEILTNLVVLVVLAVAAVIWWDFARVVLMFVVTLGILVAIHEWGHFIAAKCSGVRVYEFALGFGPKLLTYMRRGGTDYTIRAVPLGGFVNPKGMQPEDPITADGINGRRPAERALVYLAGPLMNVIFGFAMYCLIGWLIGTPNEGVAFVGDVKRDSEASRMQVISVDGRPPVKPMAGLKIGDRILTVNGFPVTRLNVTHRIHPNAGKPVTIAVQRGKSTVELTGIPKAAKVTVPLAVVLKEVPAALASQLQPGDQLDTIDGESIESLDDANKRLAASTGKDVTLGVWRDTNKYLEFTVPGQTLALEKKETDRWVGQLGFGPLPGQGPRVSFSKSFAAGVDDVESFFLGMAAMFAKPKQLGENVGGPVAIASVLAPLDKLPTFYYFRILAQLSLSLAFFNLLPVPVLDGGHMLLLTVEVLRRRRLEPETQRAVAMVGLALIGALFVFIMWKDIMKHIL
jgi:regulator of sigma E protease